MIENHHDKWFSMSPWNAFFTIIPLFPTFFSLKNSMTNSTDTTAEWYVLRVTYQRELSTKEYLDKLNIENFVPIRVVRRRNSKGQFFRACEAAVHNYIFIRSTRGVIDELKTYKLPMLRYVMHPQNGENQIMVVPEEQMRNFIAVAGNEDEQVLFMSPEEVALSKASPGWRSAAASWTPKWNRMPATWKSSRSCIGKSRMWRLSWSKRWPAGRSCLCNWRNNQEDHYA